MSLAKQGKAGCGFPVLAIACIVWLWFRFGNGAEPLFIMGRIEIARRRACGARRFLFKQKELCLWTLS